MADEVYQENVYGDAPPFTSFKKALMELHSQAAAGDAQAKGLAPRAQVISFHSVRRAGTCASGEKRSPPKTRATPHRMLNVNARWHQPALRCLP